MRVICWGIRYWYIFKPPNLITNFQISFIVSRSSDIKRLLYRASVKLRFLEREARVSLSKKGLFYMAFWVSLSKKGLFYRDFWVSISKRGPFYWAFWLFITKKGPFYRAFWVSILKMVLLNDCLLPLYVGCAPKFSCGAPNSWRTGSFLTIG